MSPPVVQSVSGSTRAERRAASAGARSLDREIFRLSWPVTATLLLISGVELIDIGMVGRLGSAQVAGVGYAAQFVHVVVSVLDSVGVAAVALIARAVGAHDGERARAAFAGALGMSLTLAGLATVAAWTAGEQLLGALAAPAVVQAGLLYFQMVITGTLFVAVETVFGAAYRARRDTRTPLIASMLMAVVKLGLSWVLIFGQLGAPRLGLLGAGIATIVAHGTAVLFFVLRARLLPRDTPLLPSWDELARAPRIALDVLRVALPAVGERVLMSVAILVYFWLLKGFGTAAVAAYAIGVRLLAFSWLPGLGAAQAAATLVGQALGAGDREAARAAGWRSVRLALLVMGVIGVFSLFLREPLARAFTPDAAVVADLVPFLMMLAVAQPFMGVHFTLSGALRGAGDTLTPMLGAAAGNWLLRIPLAWFFVHSGFELIWIWGVLVGDHVVRSIWYVVAFWRGAWARVVGAHAP